MATAFSGDYLYFYGCLPGLQKKDYVTVWLVEWDTDDEEEWHDASDNEGDNSPYGLHKVSAELDVVSEVPVVVSFVETEFIREARLSVSLNTTSYTIQESPEVIAKEVTALNHSMHVRANRIKRALAAFHNLKKDHAKKWSHVGEHFIEVILHPDNAHLLSHEYVQAKEQYVDVI